MPNKMILLTDYIIMLCNSKKGITEVLVSHSDYDRLKNYKYTWYVSNHRNGSVYVSSANRINGKKTIILLHRFLTNVQKHYVVDHINRNTLDNRQENLRICTQMENMENQTNEKPHTVSGIRGVTWDKKHRKWRVRRIIKGVQHDLGYAKTLAEAKDLIAILIERSEKLTWQDSSF